MLDRSSRFLRVIPPNGHDSNIFAVSAGSAGPSCSFCNTFVLRGYWPHTDLIDPNSALIRHRPISRSRTPRTGFNKTDLERWLQAICGGVVRACQMPHSLG